MIFFAAFTPKGIDNKDELDGAPFVVPKSKSGGRVVVASCINDF